MWHWRLEYDAKNSTFIIQKSYFKKDAYESAVFLRNVSWNQVIDFTKNIHHANKWRFKMIK